MDIVGLTPYEENYYSRQIVLQEVGLNGQLQLKKSHVLIAGIGALGSQLAVQLASIGVGYIRLVDRDIVEVSNLQRQHIYSVDVLGYPKVEAAAKRLNKLNPNIEVDPIPTSVNSLTVDKLLEGIDLTVDGLDRMAPRYTLNRACYQRKIPYIYGAAITNTGSVSTIIPDKTACLECFQGGVDDDAIPTCATVGVTPSIIGIIASIQTSEAMKILLGKEPALAGKLLFCDLSDLSFETVHLSRAKFCPVCSDKKVNTKIKQDEIEEICGREGRKVFTITPKKECIINVDKVTRLAKTRGYEIGVKADLGVTFTVNNVRASVFCTGVAVIEGANSRDEAWSIYREVIEG